MEPFKSGKEQFLSAAAQEHNEISYRVKRKSFQSQRQWNHYKPDFQSRPGKEGKTLSQNPNRKYVSDKPTQPTKPEWGEDRISKDLKLENFIGAREKPLS